MNRVPSGQCRRHVQQPKKASQRGKRGWGSSWRLTVDLLWISTVDLYDFCVPDLLVGSGASKK
jgi:hypothetical protein